MTFRPYNHLEQFGRLEVQGIEIGTVHVFPKLDGTNASVWADSVGNLRCGSRRRVLTAGDDNAGFFAWVSSADPKAIALRHLALACPSLIFYGEWMVPHTLKTYRDDVWRRFYIFDVYDRHTDRYLSFDEYAPILRSYMTVVLSARPDIIEPLCTITNPSPDQLLQQVETNTYLIADGAGLGEGVVLKNYGWTNRHGRQSWAKVVRNAFREENHRAFGTPEKGGEFQVEIAIVEEFVTPHLVGKTHAKVLLELANEAGIDTSDPNWQQYVQTKYRAKVIPQLLGRVFHDLIAEDFWAILKKHMKMHPVINFKVLQARTTSRVKELTGDLFK